MGNQSGDGRKIRAPSRGLLSVVMGWGSMEGVELAVPVFRHDEGLLLPRKAPLSRGMLDALVASNREDYGEALSLLRYRRVRDDLLDLLSEDPYKVVFSAPDKTAIVLRLIEPIRMVRPLLAMLDYFERVVPETYQHILRVTALSALLSRFLLDSEEDVTSTVFAAALHDLGKTCIAPALLRKQEPLTQSEREGLEHHTLAGYVLVSYYLKRTGTLAARVARDHHERRDSSGYPLGIAIEDGIVEIIAVSDIYDAMVSHRSYRRTSYETRRALEEITEMAANGRMGWESVKELILQHRQGRHDPGECVVSLERRGNECFP